MAKKEQKTELLELKGFLTFLILHELSSDELTGEELAVKIGRRKGSVLTPGTIYPAMKKLHKLKLVKYKKNGRKKYYKLTPQGKAELKSLYKQFSNYFYGLKNKIKREHYEPLPEGENLFYKY